MLLTSSRVRAINPPFQVSDQWVISRAHNEREEPAMLFALSITEKVLCKGQQDIQIAYMQNETVPKLISLGSIYHLHVTPGKINKHK